MALTSGRGSWVLGAGLWLGSMAVLYLALHQGQQELAQRLEEVSAALARQSQALQACQGHRPGEQSPQAGIPAAVRAGEARLTPEEVDAIALRMASLLQQAGGPPVAEEQAPPPRQEAPLEPLSREQQEALGRATALVERVLSTGRMSLEELEEMRRELSQLSSRPEANELRRRLIVAINQKKLTPPDVPRYIP